VPKFVFELESVLDQRRAAERTKQLAVAGLERERLDLEERIRGVQRGIVREKEDLRDHLTAGGSATGATSVNMRTVRLQAGASLRLVGRAHQAALQLSGVLARLHGARRELMDATTRRKAVETLRERRLTSWKHGQSKREEAALDELNVMSAARKELEQ